MRAQSVRIDVVQQDEGPIRSDIYRCRGELHFSCSGTPALKTLPTGLCRTRQQSARS
jgi:hypothetical protein